MFLTRGFAFKDILPGQNRLESADLEVGVREKLNIHRQPIVLPKHQPTEVVARLKYVIGHFLTKLIESAKPGQGKKSFFAMTVPHCEVLNSARPESGSKSRWRWHSAGLRATSRSSTGA